MNAIGHRVPIIALAAVIVGACGGRATTGNDAGPGHDAAAVDAQGDALGDGCNVYHNPHPPDPGYPYTYYCSHQIDFSDCLPIAWYLPSCNCWQYDCKTPP